MEESATVSVRRIEKWIGKLRGVTAKIDGEQIGTLKNGEEKTFSVTPGEHSIRVEAPWIASNTMEFSVASGETAQVEYEDLSEIKYWTLGACGGLGAILTGVFGAIGLPSVMPTVAGFSIAFGGYWILEKLGVVSRTMTYKTEVRTRMGESSPASES